MSAASTVNTTSEFPFTSFCLFCPIKSAIELSSESLSTDFKAGSAGARESTKNESVIYGEFSFPASSTAFILSEFTPCERFSTEKFPLSADFQTKADELSFSSFKLYRRLETLVVASFAFAATVTEVEPYKLYSTSETVIFSELDFVLI